LREKVVEGLMRVEHVILNGLLEFLEVAPSPLSSSPKGERIIVPHDPF
jgi:hypothetical protein